MNPSLVKVLEQIWSIFSNLLHYFLCICTKKKEEHESEVFYKTNYIDEEFELREYKVRIKDEQMVWVICYHPLTDKMINYRVHTDPDGLILKVEQELIKNSKRVGWKELQRLEPEPEGETDAT